MREVRDFIIESIVYIQDMLLIFFTEKILIVKMSVSIVIGLIETSTIIYNNSN